MKAKSPAVVLHRRARGQESTDLPVAQCGQRIENYSDLAQIADCRDQYLANESSHRAQEPNSPGRPGQEHKATGRPDQGHGRACKSVDEHSARVAPLGHCQRGDAGPRLAEEMHDRGKLVGFQLDHRRHLSASLVVIGVVSYSVVCTATKASTLSNAALTRASSICPSNPWPPPSMVISSLSMPWLPSSAAMRADCA